MKPSLAIPERLLPSAPIRAYHQDLAASSNSSSSSSSSSSPHMRPMAPAVVSSSTMGSEEDHILELIVDGEDPGQPASVIALGRPLAEVGRGRSHSMDLSMNILRGTDGELQQFGPPPVPGDSGVLIEQALEALLQLEILLLEAPKANSGATIAPAAGAGPTPRSAVGSSPGEQLRTLRCSLTGLQAFVLAAESQGGAPVVVASAAASDPSNGPGSSGPVNRTREQLTKAIRRQVRANTEEQTALAAWLSGWVGSSGSSPAASPSSESGSLHGRQPIGGSGGSSSGRGKGHKRGRRGTSVSSSGNSSIAGSRDFGGADAASIVAESGQLRLVSNPVPAATGSLPVVPLPSAASPEPLVIAPAPGGPPLAKQHSLVPGPQTPAASSSSPAGPGAEAGKPTAAAVAGADQQQHDRDQKPSATQLSQEQATAAVRLSESLLQRPQIQHALVAADSWEFDVFEFAGLAEGAPVTLLVHHAFLRLGLYDTAGLRPEVVCSFVRAVEEAYLANPYHNRLHAADVVQNLFCFLTAADPAEFIRGSSLDGSAAGRVSLHAPDAATALLARGEADTIAQRPAPQRTRSHRAMTVDSSVRPMPRASHQPSSLGGSASGNSPRLTTRHGQPFGVPQSPISERRMHEMIEDHNLSLHRKQLQTQTQHNPPASSAVSPAPHAPASACNPQTLAACVNPLELAAGFLAAAAHDVAHPGTTNQFQINTDSELALLYNDRSVLEHYHLATAFRLMRHPGRDLLADLAPAQRAEFRATIIEMVLATDMKQHVDILDEARGLIRRKKQLREAAAAQQQEQPPQPELVPVAPDASLATAAAAGSNSLQPLFDRSQRGERLLLLKLALHCADVANPTKPLRLYLNWANRIMTEWFTQGDRERELGLSVSPMMDRNKPLVEVGQLGFIDYCVAPLFETWIEVAPATSPVMDYLRANRQYWANLKQSKEQLKRSMMAGISAAAVPKPPKPDPRSESGSGAGAAPAQGSSQN